MQAAMASSPQARLNGATGAMLRELDLEFAQLPTPVTSWSTPSFGSSLVVRAMAPLTRVLSVTTLTVVPLLPFSRLLRLAPGSR
jgi:hypothetical protein